MGLVRLLAVVHGGSPGRSGCWCQRTRSVGLQEPGGRKQVVVWSAAPWEGDPGIRLRCPPQSFPCYSELQVAAQARWIAGDLFLNAFLDHFPLLFQSNVGNELDLEDEQVCCEALEVMTLCFALIPTALDALSKEKAWQTFIIDLLLHCHSK